MFRRHVRVLLPTLALLAGCGSVATPPSAAPASTTSASGNSSASAPRLSPSGSITIAIGSDPVSLDPQARDDSDGHVVREQIFESLVGRDADMKLIPVLATSWKQETPTTWTFALRSGVKFQNGEAFDAEAAVASINRMIDPNFDSSFSDSEGTIKKVTATDSQTIEITTSQPDPILLDRLVFLAMVPPKASQSPDFANHPVGTGPYTFGSWVKGSQVTLSANLSYWGGPPSIGTAIIRTVPDATTALAALRAGQVDIVKNVLPDALSQAPQAVTAPGVETSIIRLNSWSDGPTSKVEFRQALNYAIDKDGLAQSLLLGHAKPAAGQPVPPNINGYNPSVSAYPYDPAKARQLLTSSGYNGETIRMVTSNGNWLDDKEIAQAVAGQLQDVGVKVNLSILTLQDYYSALLNKDKAAQPELAFVSVSSEFLDAAKVIRGWFTCDGPANDYCDKQVDDLMTAADKEMGEDQRRTQLEQAMAALHDGAAAIYLLNPENLYGSSDRLVWRPRLDGDLPVAAMSLKG